MIVETMVGIGDGGVEAPEVLGGGIAVVLRTGAATTTVIGTVIRVSDHNVCAITMKTESEADDEAAIQATLLLSVWCPWFYDTCGAASSGPPLEA